MTLVTVDDKGHKRCLQSHILSTEEDGDCGGRNDASWATIVASSLETATTTTDDVLFLASLLRCHNRIPLSFEQLEHDYLGGTKRNFTSKTRTTHLWHLFCAHMTLSCSSDDGSLTYFILAIFFQFPSKFIWRKKMSGFLVNFTFVQLFFLSLIRFEDDLLKYLCQPV